MSTPPTSGLFISHNRFQSDTEGYRVTQPVTEWHNRFQSGTTGSSGRRTTRLQGIEYPKHDGPSSHRNPRHEYLMQQQQKSASKNNEPDLTLPR